MKVKQMSTSANNPAPNQFIIHHDRAVYFQSYNDIIIKQSKGVTYLDKYAWARTVTTGKYRNIFLKETKKETLAKIASGEYILTDLNNQKEPQIANSQQLAYQ